jgi:hypothetical protein
VIKNNPDLARRDFHLDKPEDNKKNHHCLAGAKGVAIVIAASARMDCGALAQLA